MPAPKGNEFYKLVKAPTGSTKKFETPEDLWNKAIEYFEWCVDNPIEKTLTFQGEVSGVDKLQRPFTIAGFCLFAGIVETTLGDYEKLETHKEYHSVTKQIKSIIRTQKLEGAYVGIFNQNIAARELGLADRQDVDHSSSDGTMTPRSFNDFYKDDDETES